MKNFLQHLTETQKTYEFKIKLANIDPADKMTELENSLEAYGLDSLSKAKRIPIEKDCIDFPNIKNCQLYIMDAVLNYPVSSDQLAAIISARANIPLSQIVVVPRNHPEEIWRWHPEESELHQFEKGTSVLDKPLEEVKGGKEAGKTYSEAGSLLKELNKAPQWTIAGNEKADGKTTNEIPQGNSSPMGSKQNKIPTVK
jgi:hypothetical protein